MSHSCTPETVMALPFLPDDFVAAQAFRTSEAAFGTHIIHTVYFGLGPVFEITTLGNNVPSVLIYRTSEGAQVDNPSDLDWQEGPAGVTMAEAFLLVSDETRDARAVAAATRSGWNAVPIRHRRR
jgi:hypothetical protein